MANQVTDHCETNHYFQLTLYNLFVSIMVTMTLNQQLLFATIMKAKPDMF